MMIIDTVIVISTIIIVQDHHYHHLQGYLDCITIKAVEITIVFILLHNEVDKVIRYKLVEVAFFLLMFISSRMHYCLLIAT